MKSVKMVFQTLCCFKISFNPIFYNSTHCFGKFEEIVRFEKLRDLIIEVADSHESSTYIDCSDSIKDLATRFTNISFELIVLTKLIQSKNRIVTSCSELLNELMKTVQEEKLSLVPTIGKIISKKQDGILEPTETLSEQMDESSIVSAQLHKKRLNNGSVGKYDDLQFILKSVAENE